MRTPPLYGKPCGGGESWKGTNSMTEHDLRHLMEPEQRAEMMQKLHVYNSAIQLVKMKLEIWNNEFKLSSTHNPIHHVESRIKSAESITAKLSR